MKILTPLNLFEDMKNKDLVSLECVICQKEFKKEKHWVKMALNKTLDGTCDYCSKKCQNKGRQVERKSFNCMNCRKPFEDRITNDRKFCSRSCAATYNNSHAKPERKFGPSKTVFFNCEICGCDVESGRLYCKKHVKTKIFNTNKTLKDVLSSNSYKSNHYSFLRDHSRKVAKAFNILDACLICGYDKIVQACHVKPISEFSDDTKIIEINSITNLIGLCPNHHWEFDHEKMSKRNLQKILKKQNEHKKLNDEFKLIMEIGKKTKLEKINR